MKVTLQKSSSGIFYLLTHFMLLLISLFFCGFSEFICTVCDSWQQHVLYPDNEIIQSDDSSTWRPRFNPLHMRDQHGFLGCGCKKEWMNNEKWSYRTQWEIHTLVAVFVIKHRQQQIEVDTVGPIQWVVSIVQPIRKQYGMFNRHSHCKMYHVHPTWGRTQVHLLHSSV